MDRKLREAEREGLNAPRGSLEHEILLRNTERSGYHVHSVVVLGALKMCLDCLQRWEIAGIPGELQWEPL